LDDQAEIHIYDPKVTKAQIIRDMEYLLNQNEITNYQSSIINRITVHSSPYEACNHSHAIAILTEWDEFKTYNWPQIYNNMKKPAFLFDGRAILNQNEIQNIGFKLYTIGR
jgi:UDPglucose 6-dehydrogenase